MNNDFVLRPSVGNELLGHHNLSVIIYIYYIVILHYFDCKTLIVVKFTLICKDCFVCLVSPDYYVSCYSQVQ